MRSRRLDSWLASLIKKKRQELDEAIYEDHGVVSGVCSWVDLNFRMTWAFHVVCWQAGGVTESLLRNQLLASTTPRGKLSDCITQAMSPGVSYRQFEVNWSHRSGLWPHTKQCPQGKERHWTPTGNRARSCVWSVSPVKPPNVTFLCDPVMVRSCHSRVTFQRFQISNLCGFFASKRRRGRIFFCLPTFNFCRERTKLFVLLKIVETGNTSESDIHITMAETASAEHEMSHENVSRSTVLCTQCFCSDVVETGKKSVAPAWKNHASRVGRRGPSYIKLITRRSAQHFIIRLSRNYLLALARR